MGFNSGFKGLICSFRYLPYVSTELATRQLPSDSFYQLCGYSIQKPTFFCSCVHIKFRRISFEISLRLESKVAVEADIDSTNKNRYTERRTVEMKFLSNTALPYKVPSNRPTGFSTTNIRTYFNIHWKNLNNLFVSESVMPGVFVRSRLINYLMSKQASVRRATP